jgi:glycosyltransferase involved in cell wall biosynthesis
VSVAVAKAFQCTVVHESSEKSPYVCRNLGFEHTRASIVIFLDSNIILNDKNWLETLFKDFSISDADVIVPRYEFDFAKVAPSTAEFANSILFLDSESDAKNGGGAGPCLICHRSVFERFGRFPERRSNGDTVWTNNLTNNGGSLVWNGNLVCRYPAKSEHSLRRTQLRIGYGNRQVWKELSKSILLISAIAIWNMRPLSFSSIYDLIERRSARLPPSISIFSLWLCIWRIRIYRGLGRLGFKRFFSVSVN